MKKIIQSLLAGIALLAICFGSSSFTVTKGGEGFQIYLNNKLLVQRFGNEINNPIKIELDQRFASEQLSVKYFHCGRLGSDRDITIRDKQNRILKEWHFGDGSATAAMMNCPVKDIIEVQHETTGLMNLFYKSNELPNGRVLTSIVVTNNAKQGVTIP